MLLYVDPNSRERSQVRNRLREAGFDVQAAGSLDEAESTVGEGQPVDCLVTEFDLPDGTGFDLIRDIRSRFPDTACILFTDAPPDSIETSAFEDVVAEYLRKDAADADERLVELVEHSIAFRTQTAYPLPEDEDARLAALDRYAVDPQTLGDSLDRLTRLGAELFDVNATAIGLIDAHKERFLSCFGISLSRMDREQTVCTYAILDERVTVIEDVDADPRFSENEGLGAANIRFYASAPMFSPEGQAIGTFCIYDDAPGEFSDHEADLLQEFADEAVDQLTLRRRIAELEGGGEHV